MSKSNEGLKTHTTKMHKMLSNYNDKSSDFGDPTFDLLDAKAILSCYYGDTFHDTSINCLEMLKTHTTVAKHKKILQELHISVSSDHFTEETKLEVAHFQILTSTMTLKERNIYLKNDEFEKTVISTDFSRLFIVFLLS